MDKKYTKERIKLAIIYFAILAVVVALYSFLVLQLQNQQLRRFERFNNIQVIPLPPRVPNEQNEIRWVEIDKVINEIKAENLKNILMLDLCVLIVGSFMAYYLSGKTLEPILETINKQKRFISDASHELKTPLTNIKTEAEVLNRSKSSTLTEYKEFTFNTIEDINRLDELVTYLLDSARIDDQKTLIKKDEVNLKSLISGILKKFEKRAASKDVSLVIDIEQEARVNRDANLLGRLISILVDNAIKYNKENGEVKIEIDSSADKKSTIVKIKDTGIGIHPDNLPRIFDRFYRETDDRNEKGFGLGLSIAQQIAKLLDIDVEVESKVGEGTTFELEIMN